MANLETLNDATEEGVTNLDDTGENGTDADGTDEDVTDLTQSKSDEDIKTTSTSLATNQIAAPLLFSFILVLFFFNSKIDFFRL